ncbi:MAG: ribosome silencing factor [Planctomycetia bacterium]|nr:ribosome silencing factor [Planctomycetia bacterium]
MSTARKEPATPRAAAQAGPKSPARTAARPDTARARALAAARVAEETRGTDVRVLDLRELTDVFDYFVVATGSSRRQIHAMADEIELVMKKQLHDVCRGVEGYEEGRWVVLDYGDVVVHLFDAESRDYWDLEQLWTGGKTVPLSPVEPGP